MSVSVDKIEVRTQYGHESRTDVCSKVMAMICHRPLEMGKIRGLEQFVLFIYVTLLRETTSLGDGTEIVVPEICQMVALRSHFHNTLSRTLESSREVRSKTIKLERQRSILGAVLGNICVCWVALVRIVDFQGYYRSWREAVPVALWVMCGVVSTLRAENRLQIRGSCPRISAASQPWAEEGIKSVYLISSPVCSSLLGDWVLFEASVVQRNCLTSLFCV